MAEYKRGGWTLRELGKKHGMSAPTIHRWVKRSERARGPGEEFVGKAGDREGRRPLEVKEAAMSADVRRLRKELEEARLYNRLLNAMIDIAEEQFEIPIRKKHGAKRR